MGEHRRALWQRLCRQWRSKVLLRGCAHGALGQLEVGLGHWLRRLRRGQWLRLRGQHLWLLGLDGQSRYGRRSRHCNWLGLWLRLKLRKRTLAAAINRGARLLRLRCRSGLRLLALRRGRSASIRRLSGDMMQHGRLLHRLLGEQLLRICREWVSG